METKTIDELTDAELARMVRNSVYLQRTTFGDGDRHARFLLVFAVPYGHDDFPENAEPITLADSIDACARLLQDDDWQERTFQVYDHAAPQHFYQAAREEF